LDPRITRFARSLAFSIGLLSGGLAAAAPTVTYFGGLAFGIQDLVVSGTNYDVSFRFGSYDTVFASDAPTFIGDSGEASAAANALLAVLDAEPAVIIGGAGRSGILFVPYGDSFQGDATLYLAAQTGYEDGTGTSWRRYGDLLDYKNADRTDRNMAFAVFTADNSVPEPGSLALALAAGAGAGAGLAWARRKRRG